MPITQEQMLEQVRESRANHAELIALRDLILNYISHAQKMHASNVELQEVLGALDYHVRIRPVPDDRATYMNEKYYSRFGKRNAKAKERQALIRAGAFAPSQRMQVALDNGERHIQSESRAFRQYQPNVTNTMPSGKRHYVKPIIPDDSNEPPLEFDTIETLPAMQPLVKGEIVKSGLDIPLPDDTIGDPTSQDGDQ